MGAFLSLSSDGKFGLKFSLIMESSVPSSSAAFYGCRNVAIARQYFIFRMIGFAFWTYSNIHPLGHSNIRIERSCAFHRTSGTSPHPPVWGGQTAPRQFPGMFSLRINRYLGCAQLSIIPSAHILCRIKKLAERSLRVAEVLRSGITQPPRRLRAVPPTCHSEP